MPVTDLQFIPPDREEGELAPSETVGIRMTDRKAAFSKPSLDAIDFAFQPVVSIATGDLVGFEALLRRVDEQGFEGPKDFIEACHRADMLNEAQLLLLDRAMARYTALANGRGHRLFLNLDCRSVLAGERFWSEVRGLIRRHGLVESTVIFDFGDPPRELAMVTAEWWRLLKRNNCKLAIEGFGAGMSGAQMLYLSEPDFIKIDPFFVRDLHADSRKKMLLSQIVGTAHLLGIVVAAVGVETEKEFLACRELGIDLVQGFLVERPSMAIEVVKTHYPSIEELSRQDRRVRDTDQKIILEQMEALEALPIRASLTAVLERLRNDSTHTFVPVVDELWQPLGIVRESTLKNYVYSPFGKELMSNKALGRTLKDFVMRCPIADIHMSVEKIIAIYAADEDADGLILVDRMRYVGFLSARSIIRVMNEKSLALARDQNPLTKLPGNARINQFLSDSLADTANPYAYVYVDLDNFKPFNDKFGFRQGDRALLLFAELMRKMIGPEHFLGHIGGDDFFLGFRALPYERLMGEVGRLLDAFKGDAASFYDARERARGFVEAPDRDGALRTFPLLSASAAIILAPEGRDVYSVDDVSSLLAVLKKKAKAVPGSLADADISQARLAP